MSAPRYPSVGPRQGQAGQGARQGRRNNATDRRGQSWSWRIHFAAAGFYKPSGFCTQSTFP